jgi:flavorubredoxin
MTTLSSANLDYSRPIKVAENVYWVGTYEPTANWLSSPYLVVEDDRAVLIDGGARSDFSTVLVKIMQTGLLPSAISTLVYQNYSPLVLGSVHLLEKIIARNDLQIITDRATAHFFEHRTSAAGILSLEEIDYKVTFPSGRVLEFIKIPFAHSSGSFVTYDHTSGILFSGDLFSSYIGDWSLPLQLHAKCFECTTFDDCPIHKAACPLAGILNFHKDIMSSERALRLALDKISGTPFKTIAPQRGSVIFNASDIVKVCELLASLKGVGVDGIIGEKSFVELGDTKPIKSRLLVSKECTMVN